MRRALLLVALPVAMTALVLRLGACFFDDLVPGERDRIIGISLGQRGDSTRIPRRALTCTELDRSMPGESCTASVDGSPLTVTVEYADGMLSSRRCEASYRGTTTSCWMTRFSLSGGLPRYASVPVVQPGQPHESVQWLGPGRVETVSATHLEIARETLDALQSQAPFEHLSEPAWLFLISLCAAATASVTAIAGLLGGQWSPRRRDLHGPSLATLAAAVACGVVVFAVSFLGLVFKAANVGLVD